MAVYVSNITIEQGFDFDTSFQLEDTRTNEFLNLVGAAASAQLRKHSSSTTKVAFACSISQPENGIISISMLSATTVNIKPGRYVYDVLATRPNGDKLIVLEGTVNVRAGFSTNCP